MPGITKCTNKECPLSHSCWRFISPPSEYYQAYQKFEPEWDDEILDETECKMYLNKPNQ